MIFSQNGTIYKVISSHNQWAFIWMTASSFNELNFFRLRRIWWIWSIKSGYTSGRQRCSTNLWWLWLIRRLRSIKSRITGRHIRYVCLKYAFPLHTLIKQFAKFELFFTSSNFSNLLMRILHCSIYCSQ